MRHPVCAFAVPKSPYVRCLCGMHRLNYFHAPVSLSPSSSRFRSLTAKISCSCLMRNTHTYEDCTVHFGARGGAGGWGTALQVAGSIPDGVIGIFHWHNPSGSTVAPGLDLASNRNEYQEYFLGGKGGRCLWLTTFMCQLSWNLRVSAFWNPHGLSRVVQGLLVLFV